MIKSMNCTSFYENCITKLLSIIYKFALVDFFYERLFKEN